MSCSLQFPVFGGGISRRVVASFASMRAIALVSPYVVACRNCRENRRRAAMKGVNVRLSLSFRTQQLKDGLDQDPSIASGRRLHLRRISLLTIISVGTVSGVAVSSVVSLVAATSIPSVNVAPTTITSTPRRR